MHMPDPLSGARQIHRVLKPGGRMSCVVHHEDSALGGILAESIRHGAALEHTDMPVDYSYVTRLGGDGVLQGLLEEAGLEEVQTELNPSAAKHSGSREDWWNSFKGGCFGTLTSKLSAAADGAALRKFEELTVELGMWQEGEAVLTLPMPRVIGCGRKPAASSSKL